MTIQLLGYEPLIDNVVYAKDKKESSLKCLVLPRRYIEASESSS